MGCGQWFKKSTKTRGFRLHEEEMPLHRFAFLLVSASQNTLVGSQKLCSPGEKLACQ